MHRVWWNLPGPSQYIARVVDNLRDGKNVVLRFPEHASDGVSVAIRMALSNVDYWSWCALRREEINKEPAVQLFSKFISDAHPLILRNAHSLSIQAGFSGRLLWVEMSADDAWDAWKPFITEYSHACRSRSLLDRSLFCVCLVGKLALDPPPEDICLSLVPWDGVIDSVDMLLYTNSLLRGRPVTELHRRIATSVVAKLALWDPQVSERLAYERLRSIVDPAPVLKELAIERDWIHEDGSPVQPTWETGMEGRFEGKIRTHSAALVTQNLLNQLSRRIWSAEVEVVFPLIEERRQELIEALAPLLKHKNISELQDMEIGQIEFEIARNSMKVPREIRSQIRRLKEMRNALAHLEPLGPDLLVDT